VKIVQTEDGLRPAGAREPLQPAGRASRPAYRKLLSSERSLIREHLLRLLPDDRCRRFCSVVDDAHIVRYCAMDDGHQRIALGCWDQGRLCAVGELVFLSVPRWGGDAEVGLSVEQFWQNRGIGSELMRRLLVIARNRGVRAVTMLCSRDNRRMQRVAQKCGAELRTCGAEIEGEVVCRWPTQASLLEESWSDGLGLLHHILGSAERVRLHPRSQVASTLRASAGATRDTVT
jgi:RimJ/RimL family protein N-acetyltransferase